MTPVAGSDNTFKAPARRIAPTLSADAYWRLWEHGRNPAALLAWGDAIARDHEEPCPECGTTPYDGHVCEDAPGQDPKSSLQSNRVQ